MRFVEDMSRKTGRDAPDPRGEYLWASKVTDRVISLMILTTTLRLEMKGLPTQPEQGCVPIPTVPIHVSIVRDIVMVRE